MDKITARNIEKIGNNRIMAKITEDMGNSGNYAVGDGKIEIEISNNIEFNEKDELEIIVKSNNDGVLSGEARIVKSLGDDPEITWSN